MFEKSILGLIPSGSFVTLETDIFPKLIARRELAAHVVSQRYYDIGTPERLKLIKKSNEMIITRSPFRISFAGGGSDLPSFYKRHGGCVLVTSINRYVYIEIHPFFNEDRIQLKYSQTENVGSVNDVKHRIFREVLKQFKFNGVEMSCTADIPAGTGLGSSSAFSAALLQAAYAYKNQYCSRADIAAEACELEIKRLKSPIGKQDQYSSVFGGLNFIRFNPDDTVRVEPVIVDRQLKNTLGNSLHLYYTGQMRDANIVLAQQQKGHQQ